MPTVATIILALVQYLPQVAADVEAVSSLLNTASTAVNNAKNNGGTVSQADWDALDAQMNGDLAKLSQAAAT